MVGVLVVDDQAPFRRALRSIVSAAGGFELLGEAVSAEQAITQTGALRPDLVVMDVIMPVMGGIEATRSIKALASETVVVLVSSYPAHDLPRDLRDCGAAAFVPKEGFGKRVLEELWRDCRPTAAPLTGRAAPP